MSNQILPIIGIGVGGWLLYEWLTNPSFFSGSTATATPITNASSGNVYGNTTNSTSGGGSGGSTNSSSTVPPIGTVVSNANDIAAQAQAGLAYIIPSPSISNVSSLTPNGYSFVSTSDAGNIFLRDDVYNSLQSSIQGRVARVQAQYQATGVQAPVSAIQSAGVVTLSQIQVLMSTQGLSGFGDGGGMGVIRTMNPYAVPVNYQANTTGWELASKKNING